MSRRDIGSRRLDLQAALGSTLSAFPRLWLGAAAALVACMAVWLAPLFVSPEVGSVPVQAAAAGLSTLIAVGALARLSVTDNDQAARAMGLGPAGLQFGRPELRLIGAALLCLIFLAMIVIILSLVVLAIFGTAELDVAAIQARDWGRVGAPWKLALLGVLGVGALVVPLLLTVRLSLFVPATLGRRQMVSLNSMGIADGSFWPLLAGLIVTALPTILLLVLTGAGALTGQTAKPVWVVGLVAVQLPLMLAFLGAAYRQLEYWTREEPAP
jgi:hypothetical protein